MFTAETLRSESHKFDLLKFRVDPLEIISPARSTVFKIAASAQDEESAVGFISNPLRIGRQFTEFNA